jgi:hypothetical protein
MPQVENNKTKKLRPYMRTIADVSFSFLKGVNPEKRQSADH